MASLIVSGIKELVPYLVLLTQIAFLAVLVFYHNKRLRSWLVDRHMSLILIFSSLATVGSLFYSKILMYSPCELCWYQRILMYPLIVLAAFSLHEYSRPIRRSILTLSGLGFLLSGYHYLSQLFHAPGICSLTSASCSTKIVFSFGFISIPLMAFTVFAIVLYVLWISRD